MEKTLLTIDEVKKIQYQILCHVKHVCDENNLKYYLYAGTMIGAARHNGFIPWDDDIDLMMPRTDMIKLTELLRDGETYRSFSYWLNDDYYFPFVKISDTRTEIKELNARQIKGLGANIDIFPIDFFPDSEEERDKIVKKCLRYRKMISFAINDPEPFSLNPKQAAKCVIFAVARMLSWKRPLKKLVNMAEKASSAANPKYAGVMVWGYGTKEIVPVEVFSDTTEMLFEQEMFKCPIGYDEHLRSMYGDYMKLPPESKRVTHHSYDVYLK